MNPRITKTDLRTVRLLVCIGACLLLAGCISKPRSVFNPYTPVDLTSGVESGQYEQKIQNFYVLMDSSSSVADEYEEGGYIGDPLPTEFAVEREILSRINQTIPSGLDFDATIRTFGSLSCTNWGFTALRYGPGRYSPSGFDEGLKSAACASGITPMGKAIAAATADLESVQGNTAVLLLSDGEQLENDPLGKVAGMKEKYGDKVCLYTVWLGEKPASRTTMEELAATGGCGLAKTAADLSSSDAMADFVVAMFLNEVAFVDGDADGDGVPDSKDECPETPRGARVNSVGCWVGGAVLFGFDRYDIRPEAYPFLDEVVTILTRESDLDVEVQGHTDNVGSAAYNLKLSQRRADSVRDYLISHGIDAGRLTTRGYGFSDPVASNATEEGRAENRRVQFKKAN